MEQKEFLELYNPANLKNLSQEQISAMATLTIDQLRELAKTYPNKAIQRPYIVMIDKTLVKQVYPLATWENLYELHKLGQTKYLAHHVVGKFNAKTAGTTPVAPVQDLTKAAAKSSEGLKSAQPQEGANGITSKPALAAEQTTSPAAGQSGNGEPNPNPPAEKPLDKMNKAELREKYLKVYGEEAEDGMKNSQLIEAIKEKESAQ